MTVLDKSLWLPDRKISALLATACSLAAVGWAVLLFTLYCQTCRGPLDYAVYAIGALLLGIAYGALGVSVFLFASAALKAVQPGSPFWLPAPQAVRVGLLLAIVHVLAAGALDALGMWGPKWAWYFGLIPFLG